LISAKFGANLITISKDTDHKTKWPRWPRFLAYPVQCRKCAAVALCLKSLSMTSGGQLSVGWCEKV